MIPPVIHVQSRAVIIVQGHLLLCKTKGLSPDFYFLPGGHIEVGESATNALIRELQEEVGGSFIIKRFLGCLEYSFDPKLMKHAKCHTHEYTFLFEATSPSLEDPEKPLQQLEEHIHLLWVPFSHLQKIDLRPAPLKSLLPQWLKLEMNTAFESSMI